VEVLKNLSQHHVNNAFHAFRFGAHSECGIHGACLSDLLHFLLLGLFPRFKEEFFEHVGPTSQAAKNINNLVKVCGRLCARQSDRDMPKTNFARGLLKGGKIMGKEYSGVLLLLATVLQSGKGSNLLLKGNGSKFKGNGVLKNWQMMAETLLEWEAFLKLEEVDMQVVKRLNLKHKHLMHLCANVIKRDKGMGMKFVKFHAILHLFDDILAHGMPMNYDTGAKESHHKIMKILAKLTQKDMKNFDIQTAMRHIEFLLLELANAEMEGLRIWEYFDGLDLWHPTDEAHDDMDNDDNTPNDGVEIPNHGVNDMDDAEAPSAKTGGSTMRVWRAIDGSMQCAFLNGYKPRNTVIMDRDYLAFLLKVQQKCLPHVHNFVPIKSEHHRKGDVFRGHPDYRGHGEWHDWALFDWGNYGDLPGETWSFVDLTALPDGVSLDIDGVVVNKGTHAVIESTTYVEDDDGAFESGLFTKIRKEVLAQNLDGSMRYRKFYLADVEGIVRPACVVPDINEDDKLLYYEVRPRSQWSDNFKSWLMDTHKAFKEVVEELMAQDMATSASDSDSDSSTSSTDDDT